jgi:hypothetical protein
MKHNANAVFPVPVANAGVHADTCGCFWSCLSCLVFAVPDHRQLIRTASLGLNTSDPSKQISNSITGQYRTGKFLVRVLYMQSWQSRYIFANWLPNDLVPAAPAHFFSHIHINTTIRMMYKRFLLLKQLPASQNIFTINYRKTSGIRRTTMW